MSHPETSPGPDSEQAEQAEQPEEAAPSNRAERRAQRRGKKSAAPQGNGPVLPSGRQQPVLPPRRAGRRGNR